MQARNGIIWDNAEASVEELQQTKTWGVVKNPMLYDASFRRHAARRREQLERERRLSKALMCVFLSLLVAGFVGQITLMLALNGQSKSISEVSSQIRELQTRKKTAEISVENLRSAERISAEAGLLGMSMPGEGQIRALSISLSGDSQLADAD